MKTEINEAEAIKELECAREKYNHDPEMMHIRSDDVLIRFLRCNGFNALADKYLENENHFWCA